MKNKLIGILVGWFIFGSVCLALDAPRFYGEEVVVTASRLPQLSSKTPWNTSVISSVQLKNFKTVGEALRIAAGVDGQTFGYLGAASSARLRGAGASQALILVDGKRINSPTLGMFDIGDLLLGNVEKIEVVRAPLSAIYGSDAIAGVVNIITKNPGEGGSALSVSGGGFGDQQLKFSLGGANYLLAGEYLKSDGFRKNSDYLGKNVTGKLDFPILFGRLFVDYSYYDGAKGIPWVPTSEADPTSASSLVDRQTDKNSLASVGFKADNYQLRIFQNTLDQNLSPYTFGVTQTQTWQTGLEWQHNLDFGLGRFLYGLEAREDKGKGTMSGEHAIRNYAAFVQDEIQLGERYSLIASLRGDRHSTAGTAYNPRLGLVYQPRQDLILRASAGTAFRSPTLNELYWNDGYMFGDTSLKPERSFSYEFGLERKIAADTTAKVNYYVSTVTDLILWDWKSSTIETRTKNVGEAYFEGVEVEWERKLGEDGRGFANYTYQKAIDRQDFDPLAVNKEIRYAPQNKYNVGMTLGGTSVIVRHVGERYADLYNTVKLAPYTVVDLKLSKRMRSADLEVAIDNLFDERYSEAVGNDPITFASRQYPMPGRRYLVGVKWEI